MYRQKPLWRLCTNVQNAAASRGSDSVLRDRGQTALERSLGFVAVVRDVSVRQEKLSKYHLPYIHCALCSRNSLKGVQLGHCLRTLLQRENYHPSDQNNANSFLMDHFVASEPYNHLNGFEWTACDLIFLKARPEHELSTTTDECVQYPIVLEAELPREDILEHSVEHPSRHPLHPNFCLTQQ